MASTTAVGERPDNESAAVPRLEASDKNKKTERPKKPGKQDKPDGHRPSQPSAAVGPALDLLNVGRRVFAEEGFTRANVAHIAKEAEASVGLLYYHFGSKEGLFRAITADFVRSQGRSAAAAVKLVQAAGVTDGRKLLLAGTRAYLSHSWEYRSTVRLLHLDDMPSAVRHEVAVRGEDWIRGYLKELDLPSQRAEDVLVSLVVATVGTASDIIAKCSTEQEADEALELVMATLARMV